MNAIARYARRLLKPPAIPRQFPSSGFPIINNSIKLEEENNRSYSPKAFYPARIGQVLHERYQIVGKLGYSGYSTVWLCRDLIDHRYVTLKICRSDAPHITREFDTYRRLNAVNPNHGGGTLIRKLLDNFEIEAEGSVFPCMVHQPLGQTLGVFRNRLIDAVLTEEFLEVTVIHVLIVLSLLHEKARLIHCDIQEANFIMGIGDDTVLDGLVQLEMDEPTPRKLDGDRIIYMSRKIDDKVPDRLHLTDFGETRNRDELHTGLIQPRPYRAPEVLLRMPWGEKVDVWNVGPMIWDMFHNSLLFRGLDAKKEYSVEQQLSQMVGLLGPPPADFIARSDTAEDYFNADGSWKGAIPISETSLEELEWQLEGESKVLFLRFMRKMLQWRPEDRTSINHLLSDIWLRDGQFDELI